MADPEALVVSPRLAIPRSELDVSFARSGGPGGQNVNKVSSKVVLRWSFERSPSLSEDERALIRAKAPPRYLTSQGELVIMASEHRDQPRNLEAAFARLAAAVRLALERPRARRATRPGRGARARRRDEKQKQSEKKAGRRGDPGD
jgi:ribosome-associated protein